MSVKARPLEQRCSCLESRRRRHRCPIYYCAVIGNSCNETPLESHEEESLILGRILMQPIKDKEKSSVRSGKYKMEIVKFSEEQ